MPQTDFRIRAMNGAISTVNIIRANRNKHTDRKAAEARQAAKARKADRKAERAKHRSTWNEWRELREFIRRQARRGAFTLQPATHGPGTCTCLACGVSQPRSVFVEKTRVCTSCNSHVDRMARELAALRAARAGARSMIRPGKLPVH